MANKEYPLLRSYIGTNCPQLKIISRDAKASLPLPIFTFSNPSNHIHLG